MPSPQVILLACGSFNPPTNMHLRMFELARDHLHRMGTATVVGGLISPVHDAYSKAELIPSSHRVSMVQLAVEQSDWIKVSDWETKQETWTRTRPTIQYYQSHINQIMAENINNDRNSNNNLWHNDHNYNGVKIKLLCGGDLLESFGTPGLWSDEDIEFIVGHHGIVVITRENSNPLKFIYNSDMLTKYMANITIVTEWITNDVSSTKIRRALRRNESVKYLIPDKVLDYIIKNGLYGYKSNKTFLNPIDDERLFDGNTEPSRESLP